MKLKQILEQMIVAQPRLQIAVVDWEAIDAQGKPVDLKLHVQYMYQSEDEDQDRTFQLVNMTVEANGQMYTKDQAEQLFKMNSNNPNEPLFDPQLLQQAVEEANPSHEAAPEEPDYPHPDGQRDASNAGPWNYSGNRF